MISKQGKLSLERIDREPGLYGLPENYSGLTPAKKKKARLGSLKSWFDIDSPQILCADLGKLLKALRLWVDHYFKPAECNFSRYYHPDPSYKYKMVELALSPPIEKTEPSKAVIHGPRGTTKTETIVHQLLTMIAIVRPDTPILFCGSTDSRTKEEMEKLRVQVETNECIEADFGGVGKLFPKFRSRKKKWNDSQLSFLTGSTIRGASYMSRQRGRHPLLIVWDDPEDDESVKQVTWRARFMGRAFKTFINMLNVGGHLIWLGTRSHPASCLSLALRGAAVIGGEDRDAEVEDSLRDTRFDDWRRYIFEMVYTDDSGERVSTWEAHMTVEAFDVARTTRGNEVMMMEYQGIEVTGNTLIFEIDERENGYMHATRDGSNETWMLDLKTGEVVEWDAWLETVACYAAIDLADSVAREANNGALVVVGVDADRQVFVLDALITKCVADKLLLRAFDVMDCWDVLKCGVDATAMQSVIARLARWLAEDRSKRGISSTVCVPIRESVVRHGGSSQKVNRIIGVLAPLVRSRTIRFPKFGKFVGKRDGVTYTSLEHVRSRFLNIVVSQVRDYTDIGLPGNDDGIDSLQMALRIAGFARGSVTSTPDPNQSVVEYLQDKFGYEVRREHVPRHAWTIAMRKEASEDQLAFAGESDSRWEDNIY